MSTGLEKKTSDYKFALGREKKELIGKLIAKRAFKLFDFNGLSFTT